MVWRSLLLSSYTLEGFVTAPAISLATRNIYGWPGCCTPIETQSFLFLSFFFLCFLSPSHLSTCSHLTKIGMCPTCRFLSKILTRESFSWVCAHYCCRHYYHNCFCCCYFHFLWLHSLVYYNMCCT